MKKSFTIIELMVVLSISLILINFTFSYQLNFMKELKYSEAKVNLAMESFKVSTLAIRGLRFEDNEIPGLVHTSSIIDTSKYKINGSTNEWKFENDNNRFKMESYINNKVKLNSNIIIENVKDRDANENGLISIKMDMSMPIKVNTIVLKEPRYQGYTRLVYSR